MPTAVQFLEAEKPKKYRIYVLLGEDVALCVDVLSRVERVVSPQSRVTLHVGEDGVSAARVWDTVLTRPLPGSGSRMVVVFSAERLRSWLPLKGFVEGAAAYPETTLVLVLGRAELGSRVRNRKASLPGSPVWEVVLQDWERWLKDYTSAAVVACRPLSVDAERGKPSSAARWLCTRLVVTQRQAEYLWRRVGGDGVLARDAVRALCLLGSADVSGLSGVEFAGRVDVVTAVHGAEDLVDQLLFERRAEAFASVWERSFTRSDWMKILGLLAQRLDWLGPLHEALGTNEYLDQVMRRLGIHRKWILHYAHREDPSHNIARKYDGMKVAHCRMLLADLDAQLSLSKGVPFGFGEVLVSSW